MYLRYFKKYSISGRNRFESSTLEQSAVFSLENCTLHTTVMFRASFHSRPERTFSFRNDQGAEDVLTRPQPDVHSAATGSRENSRKDANTLTDALQPDTRPENRLQLQSPRVVTGRFQSQTRDGTARQAAGAITGRRVPEDNARFGSGRTRTASSPAHIAQFQQTSASLERAVGPPNEFPNVELLSSSINFQQKAKRGLQPNRSPTQVQSSSFLTPNPPDSNAGNQSRTKDTTRLTISPPNNSTVGSGAQSPKAGLSQSSNYATVREVQQVPAKRRSIPTNLPSPLTLNPASGAGVFGLSRTASGRFSPRLFSFSQKPNDANGAGSARGSRSGPMFTFDEHADHIQLDNLSSSIRANQEAGQSVIKKLEPKQAPQRQNPPAAPTPPEVPPAAEPVPELAGPDADADAAAGASVDAQLEYEPPARTWRDVFVRWYVLTMYANAILINTCVWNTWGPISNVASALFGWNDAIIALLTDIGSLAFFAIGIPSAWFIAQRGTRILGSISTNLHSLPQERGLL